MAKRPLLRGNWVNPAAAIFLSLIVSADFYATRAFGEGEGAASGPPASESAKPPEKTPQPAEKTPEEVKKPAEQAAKEKPEVTTAEPKAEKPQAPVVASKPAPAKPVESEAHAKPAESKETKAAAKAEKPKDPSPKAEDAGDFAVRASTVDAVYQISWLGAHIGDFRIKSSITTRQYSLQANAELSVFFGAFSWQGATTSSGLMTANGPVPQTYRFQYATSDRRESVELKFQKKMVQDILINPPQHPGARSVPITAAHLQNVVDPLSAIVLLSQARLNRGEACNKRLPIFDGKIRYDLILSPKGTRNLGSAGNLRGTAYVCSVRFVPIAGHKMGNDYASGNTGIEVWLVPVPEAGLIVPYYIHVPTPAGTASMVTAKFDVQTPTGRHALAD